MDNETRIVSEFFEYLRTRENNPIDYQEIGRILSPSTDEKTIKKTVRLVYNITGGRKTGKLSNKFKARLKEVFMADWLDFMKNHMKENTAAVTNVYADVAYRPLDLNKILSENMLYMQKENEKLKKELAKYKK